MISGVQDHSDVVPNDKGGGHASIEKSEGENAEIFIGSVALDDCTVSPSEVASLNVSSNPENAKGGLASPEQSADLDPLTASDPIISISDGCGHLDNRGLQRTGKFNPKPKVQLQEDIYEGRESVSYSLGSHPVPPENKFTEKDSIHIQHIESANLMEMTQLDSGIHLESVPEIPAKLKASASSHENETGRSLRPRKGKVNLCELVDEPEDEVLVSGDSYEEYPIGKSDGLEATTRGEIEVTQGKAYSVLWYFQYLRKRKHEGGITSHVDYCEADEMSKLELNGMAKEIGLHGFFRFYYSKGGVNDTNGLILMDNDIHVMDLAKFVDKNRMVRVFIDHQKLTQAEFVGEVDKKFEEHTVELTTTLGGPVFEHVDGLRDEQPDEVRVEQLDEARVEQLDEDERMQRDQSVHSERKPSIECVDIVNDRVTSDTESEQLVGSDSDFSEGLVDSELEMSDDDIIFYANTDHEV
ncbi:hypothetical protein BUALT_Bualt12G0140900 [Buddleja alternifolia]|uniref:PB1-like domain-containing protein n=1 Tax=Buddleja alternifolia TaxID=168488 RepID=A0AAV6WST2_9LAMI|nr:hypothetical protein BUALT_Bualt12G0140900 [Buddleja alternifolia]